MTSPLRNNETLPDLTSAWVKMMPKSGVKWLLFAPAVVLLMAITQQFAKLPTQDLTSPGTWSIALAWAVPIMMAGLGGLFSERSGIVNIGLEGMLILGTWFGAMGTLLWGPWWGIVLAMVAGAVGGLIMAVATVSFAVDHIIAGVAINIMAPGITRYLADIHFGDRGGSITQSPTIVGVSNFSIPFLAGGHLFGWKTPDILGAIDRWDVFFVSDLAGIMRGMVSNMSWLTLVAILFVPASVFLLWRTRFGLRLRSCGENPDAADSLGVNVYKYKYYAVVISGALAGFGGGFLSVQLSGLYKEGQTQGKGFIGLATMIFGNWKPVGTALGSLLFGFTETLRLRDPNAAHGLLLLVSIAVLILAIRAIMKRRYGVAATLAVITALVFLWYVQTDGVPNQLTTNVPYIAVLLVLLFSTQRLRMPAADGQRWVKE